MESKENTPLRPPKKGYPYIILQRGRWLARARVPDISCGGGGRKQTVYIGSFATEEAAYAAQQEFLARCPLTPRTGRVRLEIVAWEWFAQHAAGKSAGTQAVYERIIRNNILPYLGAVRLCELDSTLLRAYLAALAEACSQSALNQRRGVLRMILGYALEERLIVQNPLESVRTPRAKCPARAIRPFTEEEFSLICAHAHESEFPAAILLLAGLGLRQGEMLGLRFGDFDFDAHTVRIARQVVQQRGGGCAIQDTLKTRTSNRTVSVPEAIERAVRLRLCTARASHAPEALLITADALGAPLHPSIFGRKFRQYLQSLGIAYGSPHTLRHTYATTLCECGLDSKIIQDTLGHARVETTLNAYVHLRRISQRPAEIMQGVFHTLGMT